MKAQQYMQASLTGWRAIPRRVWGLSLGVVLVPALVVIFFGSLAAPAVTSTRASTATRLEPGAQSVADYLRMHSSIPEHAGASEPAVQSVMDYLRAHGSFAARSQPLDPAELSVMEYLHAHGSFAVRSQPLDPAELSVMEYLHAHGQ